MNTKIKTAVLTTGVLATLIATNVFAGNKGHFKKAFDFDNAMAHKSSYSSGDIFDFSKLSEEEKEALKEKCKTKKEEKSLSDAEKEELKEKRKEKNEEKKKAFSELTEEEKEKIKERKESKQKTRKGGRKGKTQVSNEID